MTRMFLHLKSRLSPVLAAELGIPTHGTTRSKDLEDLGVDSIISMILRDKLSELHGGPIEWFGWRNRICGIMFQRRQWPRSSSYGSRVKNASLCNKIRAISVVDEDVAAAGAPSTRQRGVKSDIKRTRVGGGSRNMRAGTRRERKGRRSVSVRRMSKVYRKMIKGVRTHRYRVKAKVSLSRLQGISVDREMGRSLWRDAQNEMRGEEKTISDRERKDVIPRRSL
ncbi:hypothetical protein K438DRAFT_1777564 [Mycena galopus ATCC 62051]|nr:hypothetical protein K438DRAFT_1777564 [Mycena galopus ATCC 62051]